MAAETEHRTEQDRQGLTPEEKLLRAIFGKGASLPRSEKPPRNFARDQALFDALDAISESIEANAGRWNSTLDMIEEDISRSMALSPNAEAAR
jgi:hypothetical protein